MENYQTIESAIFRNTTSDYRIKLPEKSSDKFIVQEKKYKRVDFEDKRAWSTLEKAQRHINLILSGTQNEFKIV